VHLRVDWVTDSISPAPPCCRGEWWLDDPDRFRDAGYRAEVGDHYNRVTR
jgi:hypothetical protein